MKFEYVFAAICVFCVGAIAIALWDAATCEKRGPQYLSHMQQVGSVIIPVYVSDCLDRRK